jgi:hypothetical protein
MSNKGLNEGTQEDNRFASSSTQFKKGICPITKRTTIFYERIRK